MYSVSRFVNLQHRRKSFRLKNYDYTKPGLYYLTIYCQERVHLFGTIAEAHMQHNPAGRRIAEQWALLPQRFPHIRLHDFVVMPNHFHGVVEIEDLQNPKASTIHSFAYGAGGIGTCGVGAALVAALGKEPEELGEPEMGCLMEERAATRAAPTPPAPAGLYTGKSLPSINNIIGAFKSITTVEYIRGVKEQAWPPFNKRVWQCNYWERVIRTQAEYNNTIAYIQANPERWKSDFFTQ